MRRALVEISARRLCVLVEQNGHIEACWSHTLEQEDWPEPWTAALPGLAALITEGVAKTKSFGLDAIIIADLPRGVCEVTSCPSSVPLAQAEDSARLAASTATDGGGHSLNVIAREIAQDDRTTAPRQRHTLAFGAAEHDLSAIVAFVSSVGLSPISVLGTDVPATVDAVHTSLDASKSAIAATHAVAAISINDRSSILAVAMSGKLLCVRSLPIGLNALAQAMTRPGRSLGAGEQRPLTLTEAEFVLHSVGVPAAEQEIPGLPGWTGSRVLPQLQPVLQRISIEAKQAIRFSLPGSNRPTVFLAVRGEGEVVPNLEASLARLIVAETTSTASPSNASIDADTANSPSPLLASALRQVDLLPLLLPEPARQARSARKLRSAVFAGAMAAAVLVGYEWWTATSDTARAKNEAAMLARSDSANKDAGNGTAQAIQNCVALLGAQSRIHAVLGQGADASASLAMLAQSVPPGVTLKSVDLSTDSNASRLAVRGVVAVSDSRNPSIVIKEFISGLEASPLVRGAKLGTTQRTTAQGQDVQSFDITVDLVPLPQAQRYALEEREQ